MNLVGAHVVLLQVVAQPEDDREWRAELVCNVCEKRLANLVEFLQRVIASFAEFSVVNQLSDNDGEEDDNQREDDISGMSCCAL